MKREFCLLPFALILHHLLIPAMSYAPIKILPKILRQPTGLAILGSLGIHGIVLSILPVLQLDSPPLAAQSSRTVRFVQLTPAEQSRLPQATPPPSASQSNNLSTPQLSVLPPLPPAPNVIIPPEPQLGVTPSFSTSNPGSSAPPKITFPTTSDLKSGSLLPPPPPSSLLNAPQGTTLPKYQLPSGTDSSTTIDKPKLPSNSAPTDTSLNPYFKPPTNTGLPNLPLTPNQTLPSPPDTSLLNPTPNQGEITSPEDEAAIKRKELIAKLEKYNKQQLQRKDINLPGNSESTTSLDTPDSSASTTPPPPNPSGSTSSAGTREAMIARYEGQLRERQKDRPDVKTRAPIYQTVLTCRKQLNGLMAVGSVIVDPQGKITNGPNLINIATPDVEQATESYLKSYFKNNRVSGGSNSNSYDFNLKYNYNPGSCGEAISTTPEKTNDSTGSETSSPKSRSRRRSH